MNKNFFIIALIFFIPLCVYFALTRNNLAELPSIASNTAEVIKFSSPLCYECQELEGVFKNVFPQFQDDINLTIIDVTKQDNVTKNLVREYDVKLVPTTIFKNKSGETVRRLEGSVPNETLKQYLREILNG